MQHGLPGLDDKAEDWLDKNKAKQRKHLPDAKFKRGRPVVDVAVAAGRNRVFVCFCTVCLLWEGLCKNHWQWPWTFFFGHCRTSCGLWTQHNWFFPNNFSWWGTFSEFTMRYTYQICQFPRVSHRNHRSRRCRMEWIDPVTAEVQDWRLPRSLSASIAGGALGQDGSVRNLRSLSCPGIPWICWQNSLASPTGWCPPVISWFINPRNYSYICHKP